MVQEKSMQENGRRAKKTNVSFEKCPWSCPWRILTYIENLDDPQILLQNLVEVGKKNAKNDKVREAEKFLKEVSNLPELHLTEDKKGQRNAEPISGKKQEERRMGERRKDLGNPSGPHLTAGPNLTKMMDKERRKGERRTTGKA